MDKRIVRSFAIVLGCLLSIVFTGRNNTQFAQEQQQGAEGVLL
ncbi:hypothetical protein [Paenibacillus sp. NPDC057967]